MAILGLQCCLGFCSGCSEQGLPFIVMCRLLPAMASLVAEHRPYRVWLSEVVVHGLRAPWHVGSSWTRNQICVSCIGRQIFLPLSHHGSPLTVFSVLTNLHIYLSHFLNDIILTFFLLTKVIHIYGNIF